MKGSARANYVIAAPVNAEQRLLKVCVRRTPLERAWRRIKIVLTVLRGIRQVVSYKSILNTNHQSPVRAVGG